tara:strand:+ start:3795 stop:4040 length:246 start_codon:yes stop_codon:yes gene_type:complete
MSKNVKRFRVCVKGKMISDGKGGEKPLWLELGQISAFSAADIPTDLSFAIELNNMPNQSINGFPIDRKPASAPVQESNGGF